MNGKFFALKTQSKKNKENRLRRPTNDNPPRVNDNDNGQSNKTSH